MKPINKLLLIFLHGGCTSCEALAQAAEDAEAEEMGRELLFPGLRAEHDRAMAEIYGSDRFCYSPDPDEPPPVRAGE